MKLFSALLVLLFMFMAAPKVHAQNDAIGDYNVGKTSCTIEWDSYNKEYRIYWSGGTGYTVMMWIKDLPNGNIVYDEYEKDWSTYTGTFTFKSDSFRSGTYERADGKRFTVSRQR